MPALQGTSVWFGRLQRMPPPRILRFWVHILRTRCGQLQVCWCQDKGLGPYGFYCPSCGSDWGSCHWESKEETWWFWNCATIKYAGALKQLHSSGCGQGHRHCLCFMECGKETLKLQSLPSLQHTGPKMPRCYWWQLWSHPQVHSAISGDKHGACHSTLCSSSWRLCTQRPDTNNWRGDLERFQLIVARVLSWCLWELLVVTAHTARTRLDQKHKQV